MKKLFYSSAYNVKHSTITEENAAEKLQDDIRSKMLGDVEKFLYGGQYQLAINPQLEYIGGFYYEKESSGLTSCESTVKAELDEVDRADVVMISLLKYSAIATVTELLYAARFPDKEIIIFCNPEITQFKVEYEYWFPILAACRTSKNLRIVYVKNEEEILDFIKNYKVYETRIIIEGADGVGKTTVVKKLRELGVNCLDREKKVISACMLRENSVEVRARTCVNYLHEHPNDFLLFMTLNSPGELKRRLEERNETLDEFDREAPMYNELYTQTAKYIKEYGPGHDRLAVVDVSCCDEADTFRKICDVLGYNKVMKKVVVATNNAGKLEELRKIFPQYLMVGLKDEGIDVDVEEDANTFLGNAIEKATEIYELVKCPVIADDSGLMIDALDGFPGVLTHRFLGENATDEDRNAELIRRASDKTARFVCELVYYDGDNVTTGHGELVGKITTAPRGDNGFGFDPIFEISDGRTLAELLPEEKNQFSARFLAAIDLASKPR